MVMKFLAKMVLSGIAITLLLYWFSNITLWNAMIAAFIFAVVAWLVGDQVILRATNNAVATTADAIMCIVYLWIVASILNLNLNFGEILVITAVVGLAEWYFHRYFLKPERVMSV